MPWTLDDEEDKQIVKEIERQSDRAAALIAGALLEERLLKMIQRHLHRDKEVEDRMFKGTGPLASFSAKIDLALLIGLYEAPIRKRLHTIREIRNEFAHNTKPIGFSSSQRIKALCNNLKPSRGATKIFRERYPDLPFLVDFVKPRRSPREQYMSAIKLLLFTFGLTNPEERELNVQTPTPDTLPSKSSRQPRRRPQSDYHVRIASVPPPQSSRG